MNLLISILPSYQQHLETFPNTLLAKFYGCYALQLPHEKIVYVVVMANSFNTTNKINARYDIKVGKIWETFLKIPRGLG